MNILVTGGAGFIGSHLVDRLLYEGYKVLVVDNFNKYYSPKMKMDNIKHNLNKKNFKLIRGDIRNKTLLSKCLKDIDIVFHLAAEVGVRASIQDSITYHEVNVTGTLNLLNSCLNSDIKKIIHSSSSSVYGEPTYLPIDEKHHTNPISPYGVTKLAAEKYCSVFSRIHDLKIIVLRYFTVFGPRQRPDMAITKFTNLMLRGKKPKIYGDGEQTRDFTYIENAIDANILAMKSKIKWDVFNIGSGQRISVNELISSLNKFCGMNIEPIYSQKKEGDVSHTWANIVKAKKFLNYESKIDIKNGIKKYLDWLKKNEK